MKALGKIEPVELRYVWGDEARDFTPWLASEGGLSMLGEVLDVDLELVETESRVGPYKADIVARFSAEDGEDQHIVVIENQLEPTDHDHLGKIITYASGHDAATCVWVASSFTEEHRQAIDWLNENMPERSFFGLQIELIRIDDSSPAAQFNVISSPNEWAKVIRATQAKELSASKLSQLKYWEDFLQYAKSQPDNQLDLLRSAKPGPYYVIKVGRKDFHLSGVLSVQQDWGRCELYMRSGTAKAAFDLLFTQKDAIERELGYHLDWQRLDDKIASRIAVFKDGDIDDPDQKIALIEWMYRILNDLHRVFVPRVHALVLD